MQRLRAGAASGVAFLCFAVFCISLFQLQRWPFLQKRIEATSDYRWDFEGMWPDPAAELGSLLHFQQVASALALLLLNPALLALVGLLAAGLGKRAVGAPLIVIGSVGGLLLGLPTLLYQPCIEENVRLLMAIYGSLIGALLAGWLLVSSDGKPLSKAVLSSTLLLMLGLTLWHQLQVQGGFLCYSGTHCGPNGPPPPPSLPPSLFVALSLGSLVTVAWPARIAFNKLLPVALLAAVVALPALAIAHDERLELHESKVSHYPRLWPLEFATCQPVEWAPTVMVQRDEVSFSGKELSSPADYRGAEQRLRSVLAEQIQRESDIRAHLKLAPLPKLNVNLVADGATMTPPLFGAIARGSAASGYSYVDIISIVTTGRMVTTRLRHEHECAVRVELGDDGRPLSDFADWAALVKAADQANGKLKVRVP